MNTHSVEIEDWDVAGFGTAQIQIPPDRFNILLKIGSPSHLRFEQFMKEIDNECNKRTLGHTKSHRNFLLFGTNCVAVEELVAVSIVFGEYEHRGGLVVLKSGREIKCSSADVQSLIEDIKALPKK